MRVHVRSILPAVLVIVAACGGKTTTPPPSDASVANLDMTPACPDGGCPPPAANCDEVKQTGCTDPANPKCSDTDDGTMMFNDVPNCVPLSGMVAIDGSCMRDKAVAGDTTDWSTIGMDNCAAGGFCSGLGTVNQDTPNRHCRKFCNADGDCPTKSELCTAFDLTYGTGICVPSCAIFGSDCATGYNCSESLFDNDPNVATLVMSCRTPGTVAIDQPCPNGDDDCTADHICIDHAFLGGDGTCTAMCDTKHACPAGKTCQTSVMVMGMPTDLGIPNGGLCL